MDTREVVFIEYLYQARVTHLVMLASVSAPPTLKGSLVSFSSLHDLFYVAFIFVIEHDPCSTLADFFPCLCLQVSSPGKFH